MIPQSPLGEFKMSWKSMKLPVGCKLFHAHSFTVDHGGKIYSIEVDEYADGSFMGHGEQANDSSSVLNSVSGASIEECLNKLILSIESKN